MLRTVKYTAEAVILLGLMLLFRALPLDAASALGARLARAIGPLLPLHRTALKNLALVFPEKTPGERAGLVRGMWDNLGRVLAEFPHLPGNALIRRVTYKNLHHLPPPGTAAMFISGHIGNWELSYPTAHQHGVPVTLVYRHANNPFMERFIRRIRAAQSRDMLVKGHAGAAKMAKALRRGEALALLVDQKMNQGVPIPFFGRDAMTATAVAEFSLRFDMPVIPARVVRTKGAHFEVILYPPMKIARTGDTETDVRLMLVAIHEMLEGWIREHPEQWYWVHRRWGKENY